MPTAPSRKAAQFLLAVVYISAGNHYARGAAPQRANSTAMTVTVSLLQANYVLPNAQQRTLRQRSNYSATLCAHIATPPHARCHSVTQEGATQARFARIAQNSESSESDAWARGTTTAHEPTHPLQFTQVQHAIAIHVKRGERAT